jgi:hypothetical protein
VAVVEIPKTAFDSLPGIEQCCTHWQRENESAWFADTSGRVAGVLLHNPDTKLWGYCICLRQDGGSYSRVALGADIPRADIAMHSLVAEMQKL